ncbi:heme ABC transporter ATP-binding protein [Parageobacillus toebii]|uniref:heme ABC transporter ATP-binding protein n=1 Tax=Parageobacillus toebii TaxID=153151 RepID=UPI002E2294C1|nr:heme ABC transporter ATP-binding protein [Parageobacillus toebii]MED4970304.1 heme ABC transporter ATP-binding protein [Parageobacillus toebii]
MKLAIEHVSCTIMETSIIQDISIHIKDGQFVGIIGPNGSGKSTLLKIASRILKPNAGVVRLDGQHLYELSPKKAAQEIAVVSQETSLTFDFSVQEIVLMGRNPHKRLFQSDTDEDLRIVNEALERVGMQGYEERSFMSLSGGEKQRVLIARALAQQAKLIILDEPTNHLDIRHQLQLMDLVKKLNVTVLAALHDLNLASNYCDYLYVIQNGQVVMSGTPESVLTKDRIREVFGVETEIIIHPLTKKPYITFLTHV